MTPKKKSKADLKDEVELWKKNRNIYVEKKNKLCRQIEEASKILAEFPTEGIEICSCGQSWNAGLSFNQKQCLEKLRGVLKIPRKEESEK